MESASAIYQGLLLLGAAHGTFLALALVSVRTGNAMALHILALFTVTFAVDLAANLLNVAGYLERYPLLSFVEPTVSFLYGPLLYFYVVSLTSTRDWRPSARHWFHLLPFAIAAAVLVPLYGPAGQNTQTAGGATANAAYGYALLDHIELLLDVIVAPLIGLYLALSMRRLLSHSRNIRERFSVIEHISLVWLRNLLVAFGVVYLLYLAARVAGDSGWLEQLVNIAMVVVIYALGYMGMRQPIIFKQPVPDVLPNNTAHDPATERMADDARPKYEKSALDGESSKALLQNLQELMETERPYLDCNISLSQLAGQLDISSNYLSQTINQQTGSNFFDYINRHRVTAAMEFLTDPAQGRANVLTIAMESGFNSKSAFYAAFKRHIGMTPTQYRQRNKS